MQLDSDQEQVLNELRTLLFRECNVTRLDATSGTACGFKGMYLRLDNKNTQEVCMALLKRGYVILLNEGHVFCVE